MIKVRNMTGRTGKDIPNQFIITDKNTATYERIFQSYDSTIVSIFVDLNGERSIALDLNKWDYSTTTSKYRNQFLGMTTAEIKAAIKSGEIELVNLN
jgi:hypothetical protein